MIKRVVVLLAAILQVAVFASADGWASYGSGTTGGEGGIEVYVDNAADLEYYAELEDPYLITISGVIDIGSSVEINSNTTLRGADSSATLIGNLGFQNRGSNIIIERLNITNPNDAGEGDGISVKQEVTNVWVHHCTIYDCPDGCLDVSNESDLVTVSWCKFYYTKDFSHNFVNLIGSSDSQTGDRGKLRVTMHHNWWSSMCKERMPRVRFGQVHIYNCYYDSSLLSGGYCHGVGVESHIRTESNYYDSVTATWKDYYTGEGGDGEIGWNDGNVYHNCSQETWAENRIDTIFVPPYEYTLDDADTLALTITAGAGAGGQDVVLPHWKLSIYGDFDLSGKVEADDLRAFIPFWLATEGIDNADYDSGGIVNYREFSLFSGNYDSGQAPPVDPNDPTVTLQSLTIQENEQGFCESEGIQGIENEHAGYTGAGYANTYNETGAGLNYSVEIVEAGAYTVTFRYAAATDRAANLIAGGEIAGAVEFPATGAWDSWLTDFCVLELPEGLLALRLEALTSDGLANIDYMMIEGPSLLAGDCP